MNRNKTKGKGRKKKEEEVEFEDEPLYCICRSSDISRFMIGCDKCEEWYHGDCINVTAKQANIIKTFYCHLCRRKDPSLEIEYKGSKGAKKKTKKRRLSGKQTPQSNHSNGGPVPKRGRGRGMGSKNELLRSDEDEDIDDEATDDEMETAGVEPDDEEVDNPEGVDEASGFDVLDVEPDDEGDDHLLLDGEPGTSSHNAILNSWCGECEGCRRHRQCGKCEVCREARRRGCAAGHRGFPKCRMMQCVNAQASPVSTAPSGNRLNYRGANNKASRMHQAGMPSDMYGTGPYGDRPLAPGMKDDFDASLDYPSPSPPRRYMNDNLNKQQQRRLAHHSPIRQQQGIYSSSPPDQYPIRHQRFSNNMPAGSSLNHPRQRATHQPQLTSRRMRGGQHLGPGGPLHMAPGQPDFLLDHGGNEPELSDSDDDLELPDYSPCLGPACTLPARPGNKFCSEECASKQNNTKELYYRNVSNSRYSSSGPVKETIPYNLPYPDHLYCKHHRFFHWHDPTMLTSSSHHAANTMIIPGSMSLLRHAPGSVTAANATVSNMVGNAASSGLVSPGGTSLLHLQPGHHSLVSANNANVTALTAQDHAAMSTAAAMAAMAQGGSAAEDYYTICETDNLEINWPQDTVAGTVTG